MIVHTLLLPGRTNEQGNVGYGGIHQRGGMAILATFKQLPVIRSDNDIAVLQNIGALKVLHQATKFGIHIGDIFIILPAIFE
jgi:hypothetical protein